MTYKCVKCGKTTKDGVSLHEFPESVDRRKEWMKILGLKLYLPSNMLCSDHFTVDQFKKNLKKRKFLNRTAVPFSNECKQSLTTGTTLDVYLNQFMRKDNVQRLHKVPEASTIYSKNSNVYNINRPLSLQEVLTIGSINDTLNNIDVLPPYNIQEDTTIDLKNDHLDNVIVQSPHRKLIQNGNNTKEESHYEKLYTTRINEFGLCDLMNF